MNSNRNNPQAEDLAKQLAEIRKKKSEEYWDKKTNDQEATHTNIEERSENSSPENELADKTEDQEFPPINKSEIIKNLKNYPGMSSDVFLLVIKEALNSTEDMNDFIITVHNLSEASKKVSELLTDEDSNKTSIKNLINQSFQRHMDAGPENLTRLKTSLKRLSKVARTSVLALLIDSNVIDENLIKQAFAQKDIGFLKLLITHDNKQKLRNLIDKTAIDYIHELDLEKTHAIEIAEFLLSDEMGSVLNNNVADLVIKNLQNSYDHLTRGYNRPSLAASTVDSVIMHFLFLVCKSNGFKKVTIDKSLSQLLTKIIATDVIYNTHDRLGPGLLEVCLQASNQGYNLKDLYDCEYLKNNAATFTAHYRSRFNTLIQRCIAPLIAINKEIDSLKKGDESKLTQQKLEFWKEVMQKVLIEMSRFGFSYIQKHSEKSKNNILYLCIYETCVELMRNGIEDPLSMLGVGRDSDNVMKKVQSKLFKAGIMDSKSIKLLKSLLGEEFHTLEEEIKQKQGTLRPSARAKD